MNKIQIILRQFCTALLLTAMLTIPALATLPIFPMCRRAQRCRKAFPASWSEASPTAPDTQLCRSYVSEAAATLHEFGHFLDGQLGFPAEHERLYLAEAQNSGLRDYAKTNTREYFADFFAGHPERQNEQGRRNDLLRLCLRCKKMDMEVVLLVNR